VRKKLKILNRGIEMTGELIKRNQSIYFAHPRATQDSPRALEAIEAIKEKFPTATIINPADYIGSNMKFYLRLVAKADILIFITTEDGFIGKGVFSEIRLAQFLRKEALFYHFQDQQFARYFEILNVNEDNWEKYAQVALPLEKERPRPKKRLISDFIQG